MLMAEGTNDGSDGSDGMTVPKTVGILRTSKIALSPQELLKLIMEQAYYLYKMST